MRNRRGLILSRSLILMVAIIVFTQMINTVFFASELRGAAQIADSLLTLRFTVVVAVPFVLYMVFLQARADLAVEYFRKLSRTDPLTGLFNRRAFIDLLQEGRVTREGLGDSASLMVLDIDHFKRVNDTYGHEAGDAVLIQMADLFRENLRPDDIIGRLGGEEFAIALNRSSARECWHVAQRLRHEVERHVFRHEDIEMKLTVSIGATHVGKDGDLNDAMQEADMLAYKSKREGRNRISYGPDRKAMPFAV
ncbi:GGDEF domain-containing protein [Hoeflea sp. CAU 1731]